jgi:hypothetical protein
MSAKLKKTSIVGIDYAKTALFPVARVLARPAMVAPDGSRGFKDLVINVPSSYYVELTSMPEIGALRTRKPLLNSPPECRARSN